MEKNCQARGPKGQRLTLSPSRKGMSFDCAQAKQAPALQSKGNILEWWESLDEAVGEKTGEPTRSRLFRLREKVYRILQQQPPKYPVWASQNGGCFQFSTQFYSVLSASDKKEWTAVETAHPAPLTINGEIVTASPMHTFFKDSCTPLEGNENEILFDLTWGQYAPDPERPKNQFAFLGTPKQLRRLFLGQQLLEPSVNYSKQRVHPTSIDPREFVEAHYGFGRGAKARKDVTAEL